MTINIPNEYADFLNNAVASGGFPSHEDAIKHALQLLADEQAQCHEAPSQISLQHSVRMTEIRDWSQSHPPVSHFVDDSRESIY